MAPDGEAAFANDVVHGGGVVALACEAGHRGGQDLVAALLFVGGRDFGHGGTSLLDAGAATRRHEKENERSFVLRNYATPRAATTMRRAAALVPA